MPQRIQHHLRTKGWRTPPGVVIVSRPSRWANPFKLTKSGDNREEVLRAYRVHVEEKLKSDPGWLDPLRGRDLACACPLGEACHADILLELANAAARERSRDGKAAAHFLRRVARLR